MSSIDAAVGEAIRARRVALGMSQQDLADSMGVLQSAVSKWERAATPMLFRDVVAAAEVLGTTLSELWGTPDRDSFQDGVARGIRIAQDALAKLSEA